ncbi:hypothetical protein G3580_00495 [Nitrogeniibacter mangrovi]|uniref:DUF4145 domain-containing protein n=1 Tax=Nitrogeniibacter mangrovi TaxID=2016596 RepID=A0A6C1AXZ8_9RHOO|nr:hypothetical protein [Nitrogeniibacter mangrovi]QID16232.1 hypothetical protein G3580_00495 [Nitrogeniibacter mangrovi]
MEISKLDVATRQLESAIALHFSGGDYLAVVTLAGAAEEILGKLLQRTGKRAMIDHLIDLDRELTGGRPFEIIRQEINGVRNSLKHANDPNEDKIVVEPGEAIAMLGRAVVNYVSLTESATPAMVRVYRQLMKLHPDVAR